MRNGLYLAQFAVAGRSAGGVAVVTGSHVVGGDSSHWWTGSIARNSEDLTGELTVKTHSPGGESLFGFFDSFVLRLSGKMKGEVGQLQGTTDAAPGRVMQLNLRLLQAKD